MRFRLTRHAEEEMVRRGIPPALLDAVLERPEQVVAAYGEKKAYQSKLDFGGGKMFLLRVIVDERQDPATVITVYRTSKVKKYWSQP